MSHNPLLCERGFKMISYYMLEKNTLIKNTNFKQANFYNQILIKNISEGYTLK